MNENQISHVLTLLDLDYLKPILTNQFTNINELDSVDLEKIGIDNIDHRKKLRYLLDGFDRKAAINPLNSCDPILSVDDSNQILTRIDNEAQLISSCLGYFYHHNRDSLPRDDPTANTEYRLYREKIDRILIDVENLQNANRQLIERLESQYSFLNKANTQTRKQLFSYSIGRRHCSLFGLGIISLVVFIYLKVKSRF